MPSPTTARGSTYPTIDTQGPVQPAPHCATIRHDHVPETIIDRTIRPRILRTHAAPESKFEDADYELLEKIGAGGMGVVYRARQNAMRREVALKQIHPESARDPKQRSKFMREAEFTGNLAHPNIVPVHDLGRTADGTLFYAMKAVHGSQWEAVIRQKTRHENLAILLSVSDAIAFAHSQNVIHRDLKPENIMLGDFGEVLVMDWGLAAKVGDYLSLAPGGSPAYMAPEMAADYLRQTEDGYVSPVTASVGKHSDIYLLGAILFQIVTGQPPHGAERTQSTGHPILNCLANAAENRILEIDVANDTLLLIARRAMATLPEERYGSVAEFQEAIRQYQEHAQSIGLAERAEAELAAAQQAAGYESYSRALFGFQDALELWPENLQAQEGLRRTRDTYATAALHAGDFELGLSLLDPPADSERRLYERLQRGANDRRQRDRRMRVARLSALSMLAVAVAAMAIGWWFTNQARTREAAAKVDLIRVGKQKDVALQQLNVAYSDLNASNEDLAIKNNQIQSLLESEREAKEEATNNEAKAIASEKRAVEALREVQQESFVSQISLAAQLVNHDARGALARLNSLRIAEAEGASVPLDWEWQRLFHQTHDDDVIEQLAGGKTPRVAVTTDGTMAICAAIDSGDIVVTLWDTRAIHDGAVRASQGQLTPLGTFRSQPPNAAADPEAAAFSDIVGVAISPDKKLVVACGNRNYGVEGTIITWSIADETLVDQQSTFPGIDEPRRIMRFVAHENGDGFVTQHRALAPQTPQKRQGNWEDGFIGEKLAVWKFEGGAVQAENVFDSLFLLGLTPRHTNKATQADQLLFVADESVNAPRALSYYLCSDLSASRPKEQKLFTVTNSSGPNAASTCFAFTQSSNLWYVATGRKDGLVEISQLDALRSTESVATFPLIGHQSEVTTLAFFDNGRSLVSADASGAILIWDLALRRLDRRLSGHTSAIVDLCITQQELLITADATGSVRFWRLPDYVDQYAQTPTTGSQFVTAKLSPNAARVAWADARGMLGIEQLSQHSVAQHVTGHLTTDRINGVKYDSLSGRCFVMSRGHDRAITAWDRRSGRLLRRIILEDNATEAPYGIAPGGKQIVVPIARNEKENSWIVRIFDIDNSANDRQQVLQQANAITAITTLDAPQVPCRWLAIGESGGRVKIFDLTRGEAGPIAQSYDGIGQPIHHMLVSHDRNAIVSLDQLTKSTGGQATYAVTEWRVDIPGIGSLSELTESNTAPRQEGGLADRRLAKFNSKPATQSLHLALLSETDFGVLGMSDSPWFCRGSLRPANADIVLIPQDIPLRSVKSHTVTSTGDYLFLTTAGELSTFNVSSGAIQGVKMDAAPSARSVFAGDEDEFFVSYDGRIELRSIASGEILRSFSGAVRDIDWLDDERVAVLTEDGNVRVWDVATGQIIHQLDTPDGFDPQAMICQRDMSAVWLFVPGVTENEVFSWTVADDSHSAVAVSRFPGKIAGLATCGRAVCVVTEDFRLAIWEDQQHRRCQLHAGREDAENAESMARCIAASQDGRSIIVGNTAGEALIYRWSDVMEVGDASLSVLPRARIAMDGNRAAAIRSVAFTPSGNRVVTGDDNGGVWLWFLPTADEEPSESQSIVGKTLLSIPGHTKPITHIGFTTGDAPTLITVDGTAFRLSYAAPFGVR
jgi:WD40 repeat protein